MHTPPQPHILHQPGLLSERLAHVPTISFHLGTKERGGGDRGKNAEGDGGDR